MYHQENRPFAHPSWSWKLSVTAYNLVLRYAYASQIAVSAFSVNVIFWIVYSVNVPIWLAYMFENIPIWLAYMYNENGPIWLAYMYNENGPI